MLTTLKGEGAMLYFFIIESINGDIEEFGATEIRERAIDKLLEWASDNGISLDEADTTAEIYVENDDEGEYISKIIDDEMGKAQIMTCELEDF